MWVNDLLLTMDSNASSLLVLLDLSAAKTQSTIDHSILLDCLMNIMLASKASLLWFRSYLTNRMQFVLCEDSQSKHCNLSFGLPQGSVLGPLLFAIYMLPLSDIIHSYGISFHCYADDTQMYIPIGSNDSQIQVESCLTAIKRWMSQNYLQLNTGKTELIVIGPKQQQTQLEMSHVLRTLLSLKVHVSEILVSCWTLCFLLINM